MSDPYNYAASMLDADIKSRERKEKKMKKFEVQFRLTRLETGYYRVESRVKSTARFTPLSPMPWTEEGAVQFMKVLDSKVTGSAMEYEFLKTGAHQYTTYTTA